MTQIDPKKREVLQKLRNSEEVFVLFSRCTRLPYVHCDEESFNDQIYLFHTEDEAKKVIKGMLEEKTPVQNIKVEKAQFLNFYSSLYTLGITSMVYEEDGEKTEVLLEELVTPPDYSKIPEGKVRVDNPQLQLTAMYMMQEIRKQEKPQMTEELRALDEELTAHLRRGSYIMPVQEERKVPLMKLGEDSMFQPVFTDMHEFNKFGGREKFRGAVVPYEKLKEALVEQAKGIVINPLGVHVVVMKEQLK
jgi:hypothetical protein